MNNTSSQVSRASIDLNGCASSEESQKESGVFTCGKHVAKQVAFKDVRFVENNFILKKGVSD
jgi:hypothetical protein